MLKRVRVGVIGLGMGKGHALAALQARGVELAAIAEPDAGRVAAFTQRLGKEAASAKAASRLTFFDDYRTMADSGAVDAVVAALPTAMHAAASIDLLRRGVHVLCEKPPTVDVREMRQVARAVERSGLTYMFVRQQRFEPAKFAARELILKGRLGRVFHAESRWLRTRGIPWRGGWGVNRDQGGGVLLDLGIHKLDDAWFVLGCPQPVSVTCVMHCAFGHLAEGRGLAHAYDADDATFSLIRFADGSSLEMSVTFALTSAGADDQPLHLERGNRDWQELKIYGSKAGIDIGRGRLISAGREDVTTRALPIPKRIAAMSTGLVGQMEEFATAIRTGRPPLNSAGQALQLMTMLDALKRSAQRGRSVAIRAP